MKYRKLRIALSVLSLMACVLLIALWGRSYWRFDTADANVAGKRITMLAAQGKLRLDAWTLHPPRWKWRSSTIKQGERIGLNPFDSDGGTHYSCTFFNLSSSAGRKFAWMPFWFPVSLTAALVGAPWIKWRFSLRTLLVATTLVAVGLGTLVAISRP